jgi:hypothetical protein
MRAQENEVRAQALSRPAVIRAAAIDPTDWHLYVTTVLMKQLFDDLGRNETPKDVRNAAR